MANLFFVEGAGRALGRIFLTTSPSNVAVPTFSYERIPLMRCTSAAIGDRCIDNNHQEGITMDYGTIYNGVLVLRDATVESIDLPGWVVVFVGKTMVTGKSVPQGFAFTKVEEEEVIKCKKLIVTPEIEVNF